jgi:hypothetical protein
MRTLSQAPMKGACDVPDHGWSGEASVAFLGWTSAVVGGGDQDRHGSQNGTEVPRHEEVAQRHRAAPRLADKVGSVRRRVARSGGRIGARTGLAGQDALRVAAREISGSVRGGPGAHAATARAAVAGDGGAGQGNLLHARTLPRPALCLGLHRDERTRRDPRRSAVRPPSVSLRVDVLELGIGDDLFLGELRESE